MCKATPVKSLKDSLLRATPERPISLVIDRIEYGLLSWRTSFGLTLRRAWVRRPVSVQWSV